MTSVDLLSLLPETEVRRVVCYCLDDLHLSLEQTQDVLYDATKIIQAMNLLLNGRLIANELSSE